MREGKGSGSPVSRSETTIHPDPPNGSHTHPGAGQNGQPVVQDVYLRMCVCVCVCVRESASNGDSWEG